MYRLDPEAHLEDSPTAVELAAVNGCVKTFALLKARLQTDSNSEWFQLAQVCMVTLFYTRRAHTNSLESKPLFYIIFWLWAHLLLLNFNSCWSGECLDTKATIVIIGNQVKNSRSFLGRFLQPRWPRKN